MTQSPDIPVAALLDAAGRPEVVEAMRNFYAEADRRIAAEGPTCWNRSECCRFGEYGHRLYVTALEVVYYLACESGPGLTPPRAADSPPVPSATEGIHSAPSTGERTPSSASEGPGHDAPPTRRLRSGLVTQSDPSEADDGDCHHGQARTLAHATRRVTGDDLLAPSASEGCAAQMAGAYNERRAASVVALPVLIPPITADACPHAHDGRCHARDRRPLGCRIFYCDPHAQGWQGPLTEVCLEELKRLHWELGVPYFYADWMTVLRALSETHSGRD